MSILLKKTSARKVVARNKAGKNLSQKPVTFALVGTRTPPPAMATVADLLRSLRDGSFDKAAAKGDWAMVEAVVKNRRSSAVLRAART